MKCANENCSNDSGLFVRSIDNKPVCDKCTEKAVQELIEEHKQKGRKSVDNKFKQQFTKND